MQKLLGTPNRAGNSAAPRPHRLNIPLACFILQPTGTPRPHINGFLLARTLTTVQNLGRGWVRYRPTTFSPTPQKGVGGTWALAHSITHTHVMWAVSSWLNWSNRQRCLRTKNQTFRTKNSPIMGFEMIRLLVTGSHPCAARAARLSLARMQLMLSRHPRQSLMH